MSEKKDVVNFIIISLVIGILFFSPSLSYGDGVGIGIHGILSEAGQKALIIWDENKEKETLLLNASFDIDSLANFCWIIPIQSSIEPDVEAGENSVFDLMEDLFPLIVQKPWSYYSASYMSSWDGYNNSTVEVLTIQEIGIYDLTTLEASDPNDLTYWLEDNGFNNLPSNFTSKIRAYTNADEKYYFVVNKIDLENEFSLPLDYIEEYSHDTWDNLVNDDSLTLSKIDDCIDELKNFVADIIKDEENYDPGSFVGYIMSESEYDDLYEDWQNITISNYELKSFIKTRINESELFTTIYDLFEGAGTPLKISFYPDKPTYPLYISSIADNWGGIDCYFIGPDRVKDKNGLLKYQTYRVLTSSIESELENLGLYIPNSCDYISLLIYRGYLDSLDEDAIFVKYQVSGGGYRPPIYYPYPTPYQPIPYYNPIINPIWYNPLPISITPWNPFSFFNMVNPFYNYPSLFGGGGLFGFGSNYGYNNYNYSGYNNFGYDYTNSLGYDFNYYSRDYDYGYW